MTATTPDTHKISRGRFFEDFRVGEMIRHATPRTLTEGDVAVYQAVTGSRFAVQSSQAFARAIGYARPPLDDLLVFHTVFGKTVPDISLNAVANLGYAEGRVLAPVHAGDTLSATTDVIGLKENSSGTTGVVYVRTRGMNQHGTPVLDYVRWVMVNKRDKGSPAPAAVVPKLAEVVDPATLGAAVPPLSPEHWDTTLSGSHHRWGDYARGERIDHVNGVTLEEAEHQMATRLYQNTARVHFDQHAAANSKAGRRLVYGGVIISAARALSFNGLGNAFHIAGINAGRHVAPCFAGDTVYAWSEILDRAEIPGRHDIGALRARLVAVKNRPTEGLALKTADGVYSDGVVLDLDLWLMLPR